jgi:hypothetical protein
MYSKNILYILFFYIQFFVKSKIYQKHKTNNNNNFFNPMRNYTFLLNNEGWTIEQNKKNIEAKHVPYTFNKEMSNFIIGNDSIIHVNSRGDNNDKSLWYFRSPLLQTDLSNYKYIKFSLSCFAGISINLNKFDHYIRICNQKIDKCSKYTVLDTFNFTNSWTTFNVSLNSDLWTEKKYFNTIISNVSYIYILGDWTQWYETIGLDNFFVR